MEKILVNIEPCRKEAIMNIKECTRREFMAELRNIFGLRAQIAYWNEGKFQVIVGDISISINTSVSTAYGEEPDKLMFKIVSYESILYR